MMASHVSKTFQVRIQRPDSEKIKKKMCKILKTKNKNGLNITVECNLATTDFLDVTFDLKSYHLLSLQKTEQRDIVYT